VPHVRPARANVGPSLPFRGVNGAARGHGIKGSQVETGPPGRRSVEPGGSVKWSLGDSARSGDQVQLRHSGSLPHIPRSLPSFPIHRELATANDWTGSCSIPRSPFSFLTHREHQRGLSVSPSRGAWGIRPRTTSVPRPLFFLLILASINGASQCPRHKGLPGQNGAPRSKRGRPRPRQEERGGSVSRAWGISQVEPGRSGEPGGSDRERGIFLSSSFPL
jgi:hypothetical protein